MFVKKDAEGRYVQPDYADPGLDKWAKAVEEDEGQDADSSGWQRDKVMKHVRETAVAEKFTNAQRGVATQDLCASPSCAFIMRKRGMGGAPPNFQPPQNKLSQYALGTT